MAYVTPVSLKRKIFFSFAAIMVLLLLFISIGEIVMRCNNVPLPPPYDNKEKDKLLGWKSKANCHYYTKYGFRKWNESSCDSSIGNIFVIGDSYVECIESSDDKIFYSILKDSCPVNLFAYGTAGYGYTQEFLVLQKYIDSIKPRWVMLVTCANDYVDNYWGMEKNAGYKVGQTRPYLNLQNKIEYRFARPWYEQIKEYSLFLNFLLERAHQSLLNLKIISSTRVAEQYMGEQDRTYEPFNTSCLMSENILKNMKQIVEANHAKLMVYVLGTVSNKVNNMDFVVDACKRNNIAVITGAEEQTILHEKNGETINSWDNYHYNNNGQKILGQVLIDYFRKNEMKTVK